jgi:hypothetical protein
MLELVAELLPEIDDLPAGGNQFGEMLACRIVLHRAGWQRGDEAGMACASSRSFFASHPAALANRRSFHGLTERTGRPASSKAAMTLRSYPPLGSMPIARAPIGRSRRHNSRQPALSLLTLNRASVGYNATSSRSLETSTPTVGAICAILLSLPCGAGLTHATVRDCEETAWAPCSSAVCSTLVGTGSRPRQGIGSRRSPGTCTLPDWRDTRWGMQQAAKFAE